jgi:DNA-binding transcriptional ArsR family regulator
MELVASVQALLPKEIREHLEAAHQPKDVEELRRSAEAVASFCDERLIGREIDIYQMAELLELLSERFRASGLEDFDDWLTKYHPLTTRKLGKATKRHELMHLARANAQEMIQEIGVGRAQMLTRLLKQQVVNNLQEARELVEHYLGGSVTEARINEDLKGAIKQIVASYRKGNLAEKLSLPDLSSEPSNGNLNPAIEIRQGIPVQERQVAELYEESFFVFQKISLYGGHGLLSLPFESLGLSAEVIAVLKDNRASKPLIHIFEEHSATVSRLRSRISRLQRKYMYRLEPYWAVAEKNLDVVLASLSAIDAQIEEEKTNLLAGYEAHHNRFLETIASISLASNENADQTFEVVKHYAERFPKPEALRNNFRLAILGPTRLPSMQEQTRRDAESLAALAEIKRARAEHNAAETLLKMQERTAQEMNRLVRELCLSVQDELYSVIAEVLGQLETLTQSAGKAKLSAKKQSAIETALASLSKLSDLGASPLDAVTGEIKALCQAQLAPTSPTHQGQQDLKMRIQQLRAELIAQVPEDHSSEGNKRLWGWLKA